MQEIVSPELQTDACASRPSKMADHHERRFDAEPHLLIQQRSSRTKYKRKAREIIRMAGKSSPLSSWLTHARRNHPRWWTITNADLMRSPICWTTSIIQDQIQEKSAGNHQNGRKIVSPELLTDACASQPSKMADHHERRFDAELHLANKHLSSRTKYKRKAREIIRMAGKSSPLSSWLTHARRNHPRWRTITNADLMRSPICWSNNDHRGPNTREKPGKSSEWPENRLPWAPDWRMRVATIQDGGPSRTQIWCRAPSADPTTIIEDQIQEKSAGNHQNGRKIVSPELLTDACASQPSKMADHHERRFDAEPHLLIQQRSSRTKYKRKAREIIRMAGKSSPLSSWLTHARRNHPRWRTITNADLMQSPICWSNNDHRGPNTREKPGKSSEWPENRLPWAPDWRMRVATIQDGGPSRTQIWCRAPSGDQTPIIEDQIQEKSAGNHQNGRKIVSPELLTDACASRPSKMADVRKHGYDKKAPSRDLTPKITGHRPKIDEKSGKSPSFGTYFRFRSTSGSATSGHACALLTSCTWRMTSLPVPGHVTSGRLPWVTIHLLNPPPQNTTPAVDVLF